MEELPPRERGQRLLELVPRLTFDEVRRLRARLDEVDFRTDVFGRLPLELQCPIAEQLDGGDLWPCLIVSRRWRAVFLSECVLISLARSRFPGLLECVALEGRDATDAFVTAARKRFFRSTGRFRSALRHRLYLETETIFRLDAGLHPRSYPDEQDDGRQYSQILVHPLRSRDKDRNSQKHSTFYANGRLAWQPSRSAIDKSLIVVDDLRSQRRKVFRYPGIAQIGYLHLVALGECLVVGVARSTLIAWDLESNQREKTSLPNRPNRVVTHGRTIGSIHLTSSTLVLWAIGRKTLEADMRRPLSDLAELARSASLHGEIAAPLASDFVQHVDLLFHPVLEDVVFLVIVVSSTDFFGGSLRIYEFGSGEYRRSFILNLSDIPGVEPQGYLEAECEKRNSYGLYTIALGDMSENPTENFGVGVVSVNFNVCTGTFSCQAHHLPTKQQMAGMAYYSTHRWDDQCIKYVSPEEFGLTGHPSPLPLLALNPSSGVGDRFRLSDRPTYGLLSGDALSSRRTCHDTADTKTTKGLNLPVHGLSHCLEYAPCPSQPRRGGCLGPFGGEKWSRILGDDDFLLLLGDSGYTVWAFLDWLPGTDLQQHPVRYHDDDV